MTEARHRVQQIDSEHVATVVASYEASIARFSAENGGRVRYGSDPIGFAEGYIGIAEFGYAGGAPLERVQECCREAGRALIALYQSDWEECGPDDDWSCSNLRDKYLAACRILLAGDHELAKQLMRLIEHPPFDQKVDYGGECTRNEEALAFALRDAYSGNEATAKEHLSGIVEKRAKSHERSEAGMLSGMLEDDPEVFLASLSELLKWNAGRATRRNIDWSDHFLCIPGLGLSALAVRRGLLSFDDLPQDEVHFPVDLLRLSYPNSSGGE